MEQFWLVWREAEGPYRPTHRHPTEGDAQQEAERLARGCPGIAFFVVQAVSLVRLDPPPVTVRTLTCPGETVPDDLPF